MAIKLSKGISRIEEMIDAVKDTDIDEFYYETGGLGIGILKDIPAHKNISSPAGKSKQEEIPVSLPEIVEVRSESVGFFRDIQNPVRKTVSKTGQKVKKGDKLGAIESMKIMKEIISPVSGRIVNKYVKSGGPVEYGQKIFDIEIQE